jgi:GntR family transcriptional regulator
VIQQTTLQIDPADAVPIWKQIEEGVHRLVATGALAPGTAAPSVRDLARELRINPATVAKAYQRLVEAGVLTVRRGEGTFVAQDLPDVSRSEKARTLKEAAFRYAGAAVTVGANREETLKQAAAAMDELGRRTRAGGKP